MIVTCPSCEAKYRVDADALAARGNKVKCAACAHSWVVEDEGLTLNEIAAVTGVPVGTAKSRIFNARKHLKSTLKGETDE